MDLWKFSETLEELMFYKGINATQLSEEIGLDLSAITQYLQQKHAPLTSSLVLLADYFGVTCDFLLGIDTENAATEFKIRPSFGERLSELAKGGKIAEFCDRAGISTSQFYRWKNGENQPTVYNLCKIAKSLDRSVDFVLGREK